MSEAELKYPVHEKELLAIRHALQTWRHYVLNGCKITILTDHQSLVQIPKTKIALKRLERWIAEFREYNLDIRYWAGEENTVADAISCWLDFLGSLTVKPNHLDHIRAYLKGGVIPEQANRAIILEESVQWCLNGEDQLVCILEDDQEAPYLEPVHQLHFLEKMHWLYGHLGAASLIGLIWTQAYWPQMQTDLSKFCQTCPECQVSCGSQMNQDRELAQVMASSTVQPFERWGIDFIGQLPKTSSGNQWIVTAIDYATGWPIAKALPDSKSWRVADFIYKEIVINFGAPKEILSDNGSNFIAEVVEHLFRTIKMWHQLATAYHPRTNSKVEALNGLIGRTLTQLMVGKSTRLWDQYLANAIFTCQVQRSTLTDHSPFYLTYGVEPRLPTDKLQPRILDGAIKDPTDQLPNLRTQRQKAPQTAYNQAVWAKNLHNEKVKVHQLEIGEWVLVQHQNPQKFKAKWFGPYQIMDKQALGTYGLASIDGHKLWVLIHGNRLIKAHPWGPVKQFWNKPALQRMLWDNEAVDIQGPTINQEELQNDIEQSIREEYENDSHSQGGTSSQGRRQHRALQTPDIEIEPGSTDLVPAEEDPSRPIKDLKHQDQSLVDSQLWVVDWALIEGSKG